MVCREIIHILEELSPKEYAYHWDNIGLLIGHMDQPVNKILIALDVTNEVAQYAVTKEVDLLITHHPMIFQSLKSVTDQDFIGRKILTLAENRIASYAMHTNFDIKGSMAKLAGERLSLVDAAPLSITVESNEECLGIGQIGHMQKKMTLQECAQLVKDRFELDHTIVYGDLQKEITTVAVSPGSGKSMIKEAVIKKADVLITGDIGHHDGLDAMDCGLSIIDAGHYGLEYIFIEFIQDYLKNRLDKNIEILTRPIGSPMKIL